MKFSKVPTNLNISVPDQRKYIAYLWFKSLTKSDRLYKRGLKNNKNKVSYWGKKMVSSGLIEDMGEYYRIKGYKPVWRLLKVKQLKKRGDFYGFRYAKLDISRKNFIKDGLSTYHGYLARRKRSQIATVLARETKINVKTARMKKCRLSSQSVAELLGYKSYVSGYRHRKKHFKVTPPHINKGEKMLIKIASWGDARGVSMSYRMPCFFISLKD